MLSFVDWTIIKLSIYIDHRQYMYMPIDAAQIKYHKNKITFSI